MPVVLLLFCFHQLNKRGSHKANVVWALRGYWLWCSSGGCSGLTCGSAF